MVVNPFFLHGSTQEQNLHQDLVNEQLRMYGMDVYYIPRTFIREATIMREVTSSEFRSYFIIEAYLNNFDGYGGQGDIMSKFGIQVKDEVTLTISRERYENYIAPFLNSRMLYLMNTANEGSLIEIQRPREGDLIYFPLGRRLFEIKYVEHEQPFYQLGKGYTYELQCELFEYEDEVLNTSIDEIDTTVIEKGDISTIELVPLSNRAEVDLIIGKGHLKDITIFNEGNNYKEPPEIQIESPESQLRRSGFTTFSKLNENPSVIALLTNPDGNIIEPAIKQLVVFNSGAGYTRPPRIAAVGGGGQGAVIKAGVNTESFGVVRIEVTNSGSGYPEDAPIIFYDEFNNIVGEGLGLTDGEKIVQAIIKDPGENLNERSYAVVEKPAAEGEGIFLYNEIVVGKQSGMKARVRSWNQVEYTLDVTNLDPEGGIVNFSPGEIIEGETSGARYSYSDFIRDESPDGYSQNEEFQDEADKIVDTDEYNQFLNPSIDYFDPDNPFND